MGTVDKGLLERVVANVVQNAVKYSPDAEPVLVASGTLGERVEVRVVDRRGPGVADDAKDRICEPFQCYGDAPRGAARASAWRSPAASWSRGAGR